MLVIVSLTKDPIVISISSALFDILLRTEVAIAPLAAISGEKTSKMSVSFQEK